MFAADVTTVQEAAQFCWVWREKGAVLGGGGVSGVWIRSIIPHRQ